MENKNIIMLRHHPMNVKYTNSFYTNQLDDGDDINNYIIIDVTSRVERNKEFMHEHPTFSKDISPFFIGPVKGTDGAVANVFEIFWQCGKVYPCHDNNGAPNDDFFTWRNRFYSEKNCSKDLMRHACKDLGYEHKDTRYFAYYDVDKEKYIPLDYVAARKKVYIPQYAKLINNTESFNWLKTLVDSGKKIALVDFDGYNYYSTNALTKQYEAYVNKCKKNDVSPTITLEQFLDVKTINDVINCPFMLAGHGFIIKAMLQGDIGVVDNKVITALLD